MLSRVFRSIITDSEQNAQRAKLCMQAVISGWLYSASELRATSRARGFKSFRSAQGIPPRKKNTLKRRYLSKRRCLFSMQGCSSTGRATVYKTVR